MFYAFPHRSNPGDNDYYRLLPGDLANLKESPLVPTLPTYVMYHGFNDQGLAAWITQAKTGTQNSMVCTFDLTGVFASFNAWPRILPTCRNFGDTGT